MAKFPQDESLSSVLQVLNNPLSHLQVWFTYVYNTQLKPALIGNVAEYM